MRWALIGASTIATEHMIGAIRATGGEIVAVMSGDAGRARSFAAAHGIAQGTTDLDTAMAGADAVYISSTNDKHLPQAMAALTAGKHVLCEKPLALSVAEAVAMVQAAKGAKVTFGTNHHLRNAGAHLAIRDLIAAGRIGRVLSLRLFHAVALPPNLQGWRIDAAGAGGGVIADITVHDADTARFLLGETPTHVVAMATQSGLGRGVEDSVMSVWSMPSGAQVMAHESFTHAFAGTGLEVHGTEGSIVAQGVMTQAPQGEVTLVTQGRREAVPFSGHDLYERSVRLFTEAAAGRGRPTADGADGVASLAVAAAVAEAARTGRRTPVEVPA